jgi:hypothetical protein
MITYHEEYPSLDRPLRAVTLSDENCLLTFSFTGGSVAQYRAVGDCCSHSWIEHLETPNEFEGRRIVAVEDVDVVPQPENDPEEYEYIRVYKTVFRLDNGEAITAEYRNSSNGYYGGWLERIS